MKSTHHQYHTPEQRQKLVATFNESALSSLEFCKVHGVAKSSFYTWCKKYSNPQRAERKHSLVPTQFIDLQAMTEPHHGAWKIVLKLGNGVELLLSQA